MIKYLLFILAGTMTLSSSAQQTADETTIKAVTEQTLEIISGLPGDEYNWETFRTLFAESGLVTAVTYPSGDGRVELKEIPIDDFIGRFGPAYEKIDFFEKSTSCEVRVMGNIAQAWQGYETFDGEGNKLSSGINAYQLVFDGNSWRIAHLTWDNLR